MVFYAGADPGFYFTVALLLFCFALLCFALLLLINLVNKLFSLLH
jgi:hypothetical protein